MATTKTPGSLDIQISNEMKAAAGAQFEQAKMLGQTAEEYKKGFEEEKAAGKELTGLLDQPVPSVPGMQDPTKAYDPSKLQEMPEQPAPPVNDIKTAATATVILGLLGAAVTGPVGALAAMAGALNGLHEGQREKFQDQLNAWKNESDRLVYHNQMIWNSYDAVIKNKELNIDQKAAKLKTLATINQDYLTLSYINNQRMDLVHQAHLGMAEALKYLQDSDATVMGSKAFVSKMNALQGIIKNGQDNIRQYDSQLKEVEAKQSDLLKNTQSNPNSIQDKNAGPLGSSTNNVYQNGQLVDQNTGVWATYWQQNKIFEDRKNSINAAKMDIARSILSPELQLRKLVEEGDPGLKAANVAQQLAIDRADRGDGSILKVRLDDAGRVIDANSNEGTMYYFRKHSDARGQNVTVEPISEDVAIPAMENIAKMNAAKKPLIGDTTNKPRPQAPKPSMGPIGPIGGNE